MRVNKTGLMLRHGWHFRARECNIYIYIYIGVLVSLGSMSTIVTVVLESAGDKADEKFPVGVYGAIIEPYRMASANDLGEEDRKAVCKYGSKLDKIIELIKGTPKDDQVLVFVQFKDLMKPSFSAPTPPSYNPTRR